VITVADNLLLRNKESRKMERGAVPVKLMSFTHGASLFRVVVRTLKVLDYQFLIFILVSMSYSF
jgi:hypothetical protein